MVGHGGIKLARYKVNNLYLNPNTVYLEIMLKQTEIISTICCRYKQAYGWKVINRNRVLQVNFNI